MWLHWCGSECCLNVKTLKPFGVTRQWALNSTKRLITRIDGADVSWWNKWRVCMRMYVRACVRACVWVKSSSSGYASSSPHCNYRDLSLARSSRQCNQHSAHRAQPGERRWIPRRQSVSPKLSVISLVQFSIRAATTTRRDETIRSSRDFNCRMRRSRRGRTGGRRRSSAGKRASVQASILLSSGARASHCRALVDRFAGGSRSVLSAVTNAVNRASSSK